MAFFEVQCKSESLGKQVRVNVAIPGDRKKNAGDLPVICNQPGATRTISGTNCRL